MDLCQIDTFLWRSVYIFNYGDSLILLLLTNCKAKEKKKYIYIIYTIRTIFFRVVSIAQLVKVTDSEVLGGVVEVVSSIPAVGVKILFSIFRHS